MIIQRHYQGCVIDFEGRLIGTYSDMTISDSGEILSFSEPYEELISNDPVEQIIYKLESELPPKKYNAKDFYSI